MSGSQGFSFSMLALAGGGVLMLSACAGGGGGGRSASAATGEPGRAVWQLRAGLNVAALTCRGSGRASVAADYRRVLSRHAGLLARAHEAEQRRQGVAGFDRQQTRLYNRFANQRSPQRFCAAAAAVAQQANRLDSTELNSGAARLLAQLEGALR